MGETHVPALEHTIEQTNSWLKFLATELQLSGRHQAYSALRAVLHALRNRLSPDQAAHLGAQFPILVRGLYYEGWHPAGTPTGERHEDEFLARVEAELPPNLRGRAPAITRAVLAQLWIELDPGETTKLIETMPAGLRGLWPEIARR